MSCNMCTVTTKTRNVPGNVPSPTDDGPPSIPSGQALPLIKVHSFHNTTWPQSNNCCLYRDWPHFLSYTCASSTVSLQQRCTHLGYNITQIASFCTAAPNICESSVHDMFHGTLLTHKILRCIPDFENLHTPELSHTVPNTAKQMIQKSEHCICTLSYNFLVQTTWEHISKQQGQQPQIICENRS